jgi:hypothetical protein
VAITPIIVRMDNRVGKNGQVLCRTQRIIIIIESVATYTLSSEFEFCSLCSSAGRNGSCIQVCVTHAETSMLNRDLLLSSLATGSLPVFHALPPIIYPNDSPFHTQKLEDGQKQGESSNDDGALDGC